MDRASKFLWCSGVLAAIAALAAAWSPSYAITHTWNTNNNGDFTTASNWTNGVPGLNDVAYFGRGNGASYTVTFPSNPFTQPVNQQLLIGPNTVHFARPPFLQTATTYSLNVNILLGEPGSISALSTTLTNLSAPSVYLGAFTGAQSTLLDVNGGKLTVFGSSQTDTELNVGYHSNGVLHVAAGAVVNVTGTEGNAVVGTFSGVSGTVNVSGLGATWNNTSDSGQAPLVIGSQGSGALNITAGGSVNDFSSILAMETGSLGSVLVDGAGSSWTNRGSSNVGRLGTAFLTISGGGSVNDNDATLGFAQHLGGGNIVRGSGEVLVTGAGSKWSQSNDLRIGEYLGTVVPGGDITGLGTLKVNDGGRVSTGGDAFVDALNNMVTVTGAASKWEVAGTLNVENGATLDIVLGGSVSSNNAVAGERGGTVHVNGPGSTWNVPDTLIVGRSGDGEVQLNAGGRLDSRIAFVGVQFAIFTASHGLVSVDGPGSTWNGEQLFIGSDGQGTLSVTGGGQVMSRTGQLGLLSSGTGIVHVHGTGSKWTNSENLYVGVAGTGNLRVYDGGSVAVDGMLSIGPRGTLQGNSNIVADVHNGGKVAPGVSPSFIVNDAFGTLSVEGNFTQSNAGSLQIQLASLTTFDKLTIDGTASLSGRLELSTALGFTPAVGDKFEIITASGGVDGTFTQVSAVGISQANVVWQVLYTQSAVFLQVGVAGDFNLNGIVDAADYVVWRKTDGTLVGYNAWRAHFGQPAGSGTALSFSEPLSAAVPEPANLVLLIFAMASWCVGDARPHTKSRKLIKV
jgi:T5SS/PEP-CTERM-associated repeat protein